MIRKLLRKQRFDAALSDRLRAYALALTRDRDLAEDLAQETLLKMLKWRQLPRKPRSLQRYAFKMLRNLHIDGLRKNKLRREYSAEQERLRV